VEEVELARLRRSGDMKYKPAPHLPDFKLGCCVIATGANGNSSLAGKGRGRLAAVS